MPRAEVQRTRPERRRIAQVSLAGMLFVTSGSTTACLWGNGQEGKNFAECGSVDCRIDWAVQRWDGQRGEVLRVLDELQDPVERVALVEALVEAHPDDSEELCRRIPDGSGRDRCIAMADRPHLWGAPELDEQEARIAIIPALAPDYDARSPWKARQPLVVDCASGRARNTCQWEAALAHVDAGRIDEAGRACMAMVGESWQQECFFQSAGRAYFTGLADRAAKAVSLCRGSGPFLRYCLSTLTNETVRLAPSASWPSPEPWARLARITADLRLALSELDPALSDQVVDGVWSVSMAGAYHDVSRVGGLPLRAAPEEAAPFARAAAAWRLVQLEGGEERSLAQWLARLDQALSEQRGDPLDPPPEPWEQAMHDQAPAGPREWGDRPRIPYLWQGARTWSADPHEDAAICLVEALGQRGEGHEAALEEALGAPQESVRWTAREVLEERGWRFDAVGRPTGTTEPVALEERGPRPLEPREPEEP